MATFGITPVTGYPQPPSDDFPQFIQFQENGENLGAPDADTLNFGNGITATRGTGENSNIVSVTATGGGGSGPVAWRSITGNDTLLLADAENAIATNGGAPLTITVPPHADVAYDSGVSILIKWETGEQPTIVGGAGVAVDVDPSFNPAVARVNGVISLINRDTDWWVLAGDLDPAGNVGFGTVTAVGLDMPAEFSVDPYEITEAGVFTVTKANQSANRVWAGPAAGGAAPPAFRPLVNADLPLPSRAFTWRTAGAGSFSLVLGDAWNGIGITAGGTVTIPAHSSVAFDDGTSILLSDETYANPFDIVGAGGVTVRHRAALLPASAGEHALVTIVQRGINNWVVAGDLEVA